MTATYALATPGDDTAMRALLRENAMPSWVSMAATREPSFFAGMDHFGRDWAVVAREAGKVVGMYACSDHPVRLNGNEVELGYLGSLRVAPQFRHRLSILRDGYASIQKFSPKRHAELWYTAIASENRPARRLLERNLKGMPRYRAINEMVTLALPKARGRKLGLWRRASPDETASLCRFYNHHALGYQLSPVLTPERAAQTGAHFHIAEDKSGLNAVMALWNQQPYKQVMASAYRQPLGLLLPLYNLYAHLAKRVALPPIGKPLDHTYLAFLAVAPTAEENVSALVADALALCPTPVLSLGLHADHRWLAPLIRSFRPATYRTCLYTVDFGEAFELDGRPAQPEVALL